MHLENLFSEIDKIHDGRATDFEKTLGTLILHIAPKLEHSAFAKIVIPVFGLVNLASSPQDYLRLKIASLNF